MLAVEVNGDLLEKGFIELVFVLKFIWSVNNNDKILIYGIIRTRIDWQSVTYDGEA